MNLAIAFESPAPDGVGRWMRVFTCRLALSSRSSTR